MADITLTQPAAGEHVVITPEANARFVFSFPTDDVTLDHPEGSDNLLFTFGDGSSIEITDFYRTYSREEMPEFEIDGQVVAGEEFFNAFGPDLMPAAGPASTAGSSAQGGRFHLWADASLMDGINHLDGLDIQNYRDAEIHYTLETHGPDDEYGEEKGLTSDVSISAENITEGDSASVVFTIQFSTPPQGEAYVHVQVGDHVYFVPVDENGTGLLTIPADNGEDPYRDPSSITAEIVGVDGGNYTDITVEEPKATAEVEDTIDTTKVSITTGNYTEADPEITFEIRLSNPPDPTSVGETVAQVLVGGKTYDVTIDAEGHGILTIKNPNTEDVYKDPSSLTARVVSVTGGNFEKVDLSGATTTAEIIDTIDTTTVEISARNDGDTTVTFDLELSNPPDPAHPNDTTIQVRIGDTEYTVPVDEHGRGTLTVDAPSDGSAVTATVIGVTGGNYEKVVTGQTETVKGSTPTPEPEPEPEPEPKPGPVPDPTPGPGPTPEPEPGSDPEPDEPDPEPVEHTLSVGASSVTVHESGLSAGSRAGQSSSPITQEGSVHIETTDIIASARISGTVVIENNEAVVGARIETDGGYLTILGYDTERQELSYEYTLTDNVHHDITEHNESVSTDLTLSVTTSGNLKENGTITITINDDVPVLSEPSESDFRLSWTGEEYQTASGTISLTEGADRLKELLVRVDDEDAHLSLGSENGTEGTITLNDGSTFLVHIDENSSEISYTYTPISTTDSVEHTFTFIATDTDNDSSDPQDVHIAVERVTADQLATSLDAVVVHEAYLAKGTKFGTEPLEGGLCDHALVAVPDGYRIDTSQWDAHEDGSFSIDASDGKGTFLLNGSQLTYTLHTACDHSREDGEGEQVTKLSELTLIHEQTGTLVHTTLPVIVLDDAPVVTIGATKLTYEYSTVEAGENDLEELPTITFTGYKGKDTNIDLQYWKNSGITLSAGLLETDSNGDIIFHDTDQYLLYSHVNERKNGLNVSGGRNADEISHNSDGLDQAVIVDLGGKIAYGMNLELGVLRTVESDPTRSDANNERARLLFYRTNPETQESELIDQVIVQSTTRTSDEDASIMLGSYVDAEGHVKAEISGVRLISELSPDGYVTGFDKVVIAALGYGDPIPGVGKSTEDSDFVIRSIKFPTRFNSTALVSITGSVDIDPGADGFSEGVSPLRFACGESFWANIEGQDVKVYVTVSSDGTAVVANYEGTDHMQHVLFTGNMNPEILGQFEIQLFNEFTVRREDGSYAKSYDVSFIMAEDADGDAPVLSDDSAAPTVSIATTAFDVSIVSDDGEKIQQTGDEATVEVRIDTATLVPGTGLTLHAEGGELGARDYDLVWNGETFVSNTPGFSLTYVEDGVYRWQEHISTADGLRVSGSLKPLDGSARTSGDSTILAHSTLDSIVRNAILNDSDSAEIRELGVYADSNYSWNESGSVDGAIHGSFTQDTFVNNDNALKFELTPISRTADSVNYRNAQYTYSDPDENGWVTIRYTGGITNVLVRNGSGRAELPEDAFSITYNQYTGEYRVHIDNDLPFLPLGQNYDKATASVAFTLSVHNSENDETLATKTFEFRLMGGNDVPELGLYQSVTDTDEITGLLDSSTVYVRSSDVETADRTIYRVFTKTTINTGVEMIQGEPAEWVSGLTDDQLVYNEANLDLWMNLYTQAVGEAGTTAADKETSTFLNTPTQNLGISVTGIYGTFKINGSTGECTYTLKNNVYMHEGDTVGETFHVLMQDSMGAFDIRDVTFFATKDADGSIRYQAGTIAGGDETASFPLIPTSEEVTFVQSTVLEGSKTLDIRELGVHDRSNYTYNQAGTVDGDLVGSFTKDGFVNENNLSFALTHKSVPGAGENALYDYSLPDADGWVTITYTGGSRNVLSGDTTGSTGELPEGTFSISYNQNTGDYRFHINDDFTPSSKSVEFNLAVKNADGIKLLDQPITVKLHGTNDIPVLHQVDADGNEITGLVEGNVGCLATSDLDYNDTATYSVFTRETENKGTEKLNEVDAVWRALTSEERIYNEANLDLWMERYAEAVGNAGTTSSNKGSFLATPTQYLGNVAQGNYGTFSIDAQSGEFSYSLRSSAYLDNGETVRDTFHVLVKDSKGAFDIKDITFQATKNDDGSVHYQSGSPLSFPELPVYDIEGLGSETIAIRELGAHAKGNYLTNQTGTKNGVLSGTFDVPNDESHTFSLVPKGSSSAEYTVSQADADGWVNIEYTGGLTNIPLGGLSDNVRAELPGGAFSVSYNQNSGDYKLHIDNDLSFSELRGSWDSPSATVLFTLYVKDADGVRVASKDITINLKAANDIPTLYQSDADGNEITGIVDGSVGYVSVSDPDANDSATYSVFTHETKNEGKDYVGKNLSEWSTSFTQDELFYNEANLDLWMERYTEVVGEAGTLSADKNNNNTTFLKTPTKNLGTEADGTYGTFSIDSKTGRFEYTLHDEATLTVGDTVEETFHVLVQDCKGAFDIKDVTFHATMTDDGVSYQNGSLYMFAAMEEVTSEENAVSALSITNNDAASVSLDSSEEPSQGNRTDDDTAPDQDSDDSGKFPSAAGTEDGQEAGGIATTADNENDLTVLYSHEYENVFAGGDGNDLMLFESSPHKIDGGGGFNILAGEGAVDALLGRSDAEITNISMAVETRDLLSNEDLSSLTNMKELADLLHLNVGEDGLIMPDSDVWKEKSMPDIENPGFAMYTHGNSSGTDDVLLVKTLVETGS